MIQSESRIQINCVDSHFKLVVVRISKTNCTASRAIVFWLFEKHVNFRVTTCKHSNYQVPWFKRIICFKDPFETFKLVILAFLLYSPKLGSNIQARMPSISDKTSNSIDILFKTENNYVLHLTVNKFHEFRRFTRSFAVITQVAPSKLRFMFRGQELEEHKTPYEINYQTCELIEVVQISLWNWHVLLILPL